MVVVSFKSRMEAWDLRAWPVNTILGSLAEAQWCLGPAGPGPGPGLGGTGHPSCWG